MQTNNKLREALVSVKKSIDEMGAASLDGDPEVLLMSLTQVCARLSARIDAALAEPVKNYERFANAEEAWDAYDEWVESYRSKGKTEPFNEFGWLFAPATEQEGGAK